MRGLIWPIVQAEDSIWTNTWDYKDRLIQSTNGTTTTTYKYDYDVNRIVYSDGASTTTYPNKYYSINGATTTKHIFANNKLIATIVSDGNSTTTHYVHTDHLGGSSVITNENGDLVQLLDYYPFGDIRLNEKQNSFDEKRKFTGHEYDDDTDLTYAIARYYNGGIGKFLSVDPATKIPNKDLLTKPQELNSYSYVANNPLKYIDPTGEETVMFAGLGNYNQDMQNIQQSIHNKANDMGVNVGNVSIYKHQDIKQAYNSILNSVKENSNEPIVIVGHSLGGNSANKLAQMLNDSNVGVDVLIQIDSFGFYDNKAPGNVGHSLNYYQTKGLFKGEENVKNGALNIRIDNTSHTSIDRNERVVNDITNLTVGAHNNNTQRNHSPQQKQGFFSRVRQSFSSMINKIIK